MKTQENHGKRGHCREDHLGLSVDSASGSRLQLCFESEYFFRDFVEVDLVLAVGDLIAKFSHTGLIRIGKLAYVSLEAPQIDGLRADVHSVIARRFTRFLSVYVADRHGRNAASAAATLLFRSLCCIAAYSAYSHDFYLDLQGVEKIRCPVWGFSTVILITLPDVGDQLQKNFSKYFIFECI